MSARPPRAEAGHTLLQVAIGCVVLTVLAGSVVVGAAAHARGVVRAEEEWIAVTAAESRIAEIRAGRVPPVARFESWSGPRIDGGPWRGLPDARLVQTVEPAGDGLLRVGVEVHWGRASGGRASGSVSLETLVGEER